MNYYYIDGYNLIFSLIDSKENIRALREKTVRHLQKKFALLRLSGTLVFDGSHRREEESGLSYPSPLIVAYTPKGQSADAFIVEKVESASNPKIITVVTNDKGLALQVRSCGAKVQSNKEFVRSLMDRSKKKSKKETEVKDTQQNIERLLKIFEEKLNNPDEDF